MKLSNKTLKFNLLIKQNTTNPNSTEPYQLLSVKKTYLYFCCLEMTLATSIFSLPFATPRYSIFYSNILSNSLFTYVKEDKNENENKIKIKMVTCVFRRRQ